MEKFAAIVLAGGKGTRMESESPKVLQEINSKPLAQHTIDKLKSLGLKKIVVVVGHKKELIIQKLGSETEYAIQKDLSGTATATRTGLEHIPNDVKAVIVVNGDDSVFYKTETLKEVIKSYNKSGKKMAIVTSIQEYAEVSGRVIRNSAGKILEIKANSKMTEEELSREKELVCGFYIFDKAWISENLDRIEPGKKREYNLTKLIDFALEEEALIDIRLADPNEWRSINTLKELENARILWKKLHTQ